MFAGPGDFGALESILAGCRNTPAGIQSAQNYARAVCVAPLERVGVAGREVYSLRQQSTDAWIEFEADLCPLSHGDLFRDYLAKVFSAILGAEGHIRTYGDRHREWSFVAKRAPIGRVGYRQQWNEFLELLEYPRDGPELFGGADPDLLKFVFGFHASDSLHHTLLCPVAAHTSSILVAYCVWC